MNNRENTLSSHEKIQRGLDVYKIKIEKSYITGKINQQEYNERMMRLDPEFLPFEYQPRQNQLSQESVWRSIGNFIIGIKSMIDVRTTNNVKKNNH